MKWARRRAMYVATSVVVVVLLLSSAATAEKIQYQLKVKKGQKFSLKTVTDQKITQTMGGQEQTMGQSMGLGMDLDVVSVDPNGDCKLDYTYSWVKAGRMGPTGTVEYDSSKKDVPVAAGMEGYAAMVGLKMSVTMTPKGQVRKVEGIEQMQESIRKKLPGGAASAAMMAGVQQLLNPEAIKGMMEAAMCGYPDKPVDVGESWSKTVTMSGGLPLITETRWTVKSRQGNVATLDVVSTIKANPNAAPMQMGQAKMSYDISGQQKGTVLLDETTGLMTSSKMTQELAGQVKVTASAGAEAPPQTMAIPISIKTAVTTEITERKS